MKPTDRLIGRRELIVRTAGVVSLATFGMGTLTRTLAQSASSVALTPEQTEGPYWIDEKLNHSDLATDPTDNSVQAGLPLILSVTASQILNGAMVPLKDAYIDLWHCNAYGAYSDEASYNPGGGTGTITTTGKKFLRGYQVTDARGSTRFTSIYPGWYSGRTPHIHCRLRTYSGSTVTYDFTTQFFFDDAITDVVYQLAPYSGRPTRDTLNAIDGVYNGTDCLTSKTVGSETLLRLAADSSHAVASYNVVVDFTNPYNCGTTGGGGTPPTGGPGGSPPTGGPPPGTPGGGGGN